LQQLLK